MDKIRAVVTDPAAPDRLVIREVDPPEIGADQALVRVRAISLNRGEILRVFNQVESFRPGWDFSGTVEQAARDGSGPRAGTRVVGFLPSGAWAEQVAVPTRLVAALPEGISFQQAATLPVAGLTALFALEKYGLLVGRKVLVTGASGGVGDYAVQLAKLSGAEVVGLVHQPAHKEMVLEIGADRVVASEDGTEAAAFGPYDLIADALGGKALSTVIQQVAPYGLCITYSSGLTGTDLAFSRRSVSYGARLYFFLLLRELEQIAAAPGLERLARLVAAGKLRPTIEVEATWNEIGPVARRLVDRSFSGKAVLMVE